MWRSGMTVSRKTKTHDSWARMRVAVNGEILANTLEKGTLVTEIATRFRTCGPPPPSSKLPGRHDHRLSHRLIGPRRPAANGLTSTRATDFPLPLP